MSFTSEIQPFDAEIEALTAKIQGLSSKHTRSTLQTLLSLISSSANASPIEILRKWLSRAETTEKTIKLFVLSCLFKPPIVVETYNDDSEVQINASEITNSKIIEVFDLKFDKRNQWTLAEDNLVDAPSVLKRNLRDLEDALYDEDSEATCRIAVDIMLVQCRKYLRHKYRFAETSHSIEANVTDANNSLNPRKAVVNMIATEPVKRVKLFPETSISIEIPNKLASNGKVLVTGRADWALGYSTAGDEGTLLIAMEAKQRSEFSKGESQLIAYLAILRENRLRARKTNNITQGFYSDGTRFAFICITANGSVQQSAIFNIDFESHLKIVFNFIVTIMETAMKCTPNATPTKPGRQQEKEVNHFEDEVWTKVYAQMDATIALCVEADVEDAV